MDERDNVAIVANDGGLDAGARSLRLRRRAGAASSACRRATRSRSSPIGDGEPVRPLRHPDRLRRRGDRRRQLGARAAAADAGGALARGPADGDRAAPAPPPPLEGFTFEGFRNADGSVGTRNILAITTTVQCVAGVVEFAVARIKAELLPQLSERRRRRRPRAQLRLRRRDRRARRADPDPDAAQHQQEPELRRRDHGREPRLREAAARAAAAAGLASRSATSAATADDPALDVVRLQDEAHVGFASMIDSILASASRHLERLNARRRETVPASALVVGVQCGGSDAFSGATANPAVGVCTDLLVRAGATVMFSEITEVRDGIDQLTARAATPGARGGDGARDGVVRRLPRPRRRRPQRQHDAGQQEGRPRRTSSRRRWARSSSRAAAPIVGVLGPGERLRDRA